MSVYNKNKRNKSSSRVQSFSIPDSDHKGHENVTKIKEHCKKTGKNFSFIVLKGIEHQIKELDL